MPGLAHCCIPECQNRRSSCKWGLFPMDTGRYEKKRLCGSQERNHVGTRRNGCWGAAECCQRVTFHALPSDVVLRKVWLAKIRRENIIVNANTRVCSVHFDGKINVKAGSVPSVFSVVSKTCEEDYTCFPFSRPC